MVISDQLILNHLALSKYKEKYIIGTGLNSLGETINLMSVARSLNFKKFLIMPPAYYKYGDKEVIEFYSKIADAIPDSKIILYNFEKLCGYKFSIECVKKLVSKYPNNIVGVKDSSYNLFENLKIDNFSVLPGSESKLLIGLKLGCSGIITATCNATSELARSVYDDFQNGNEQKDNQKLCDVRNAFEKYNLISGLHTYFGKNDASYNISKANLNGDILSIIVEYSGGCKQHRWALIGSKSFMKSLPPKKGLFLEHNSQNDVCRKLITDTLLFDASTAKYPGKEKNYNVIFILNGYKENLVYNY